MTRRLSAAELALVIGQGIRNPFLQPHEPFPFCGGTRTALVLEVNKGSIIYLRRPNW